MAERSYPLDETWYGAKDAQMFHCTRTSGVFCAEEDFKVTQSGGMNITLSAGVFWASRNKYAGAVYTSDTAKDFTIETADGQFARIDRVVIRWDFVQNEIFTYVKKGTPSNKPSPPALSRDSEGIEWSVYQQPVGRGAVDLTVGIDERLDENVCGLMRDGVTGIPTQDLFDTWQAAFEEAQDRISNFWQSIQNEGYLQPDAEYEEIGNRRVFDAINEVSIRAKKNLLANGGMRIWQRGGRFPQPLNAGYLMDRWRLVSSVNTPEIGMYSTEYHANAGMNNVWREQELGAVITSTNGTQDIKIRLSQPMDNISPSEIEGTPITFSGSFMSSTPNRKITLGIADVSNWEDTEKAWENGQEFILTEANKLYRFEVTVVFEKGHFSGYDKSIKDNVCIMPSIGFATDQNNTYGFTNKTDFDAGSLFFGKMQLCYGQAAPFAFEQMSTERNICDAYAEVVLVGRSGAALPLLGWGDTTGTIMYRHRAAKRISPSVSFTNLPPNASMGQVISFAHNAATARSYSAQGITLAGSLSNIYQTTFTASLIGFPLDTSRARYDLANTGYTNLWEPETRLMVDSEIYSV